MNGEGVQLAALSYPHLSKEEIFHGVERFHKRFYFRPSKIWEIVSEMLGSWELARPDPRSGQTRLRRFRLADYAKSSQNRVARGGYPANAG